MTATLRVVLFVLYVSAVADIEIRSFQRDVWFAVFSGVLLVAAVWAWRRRADFAASPANVLQFEDVPVADVFPLDLHGEPAREAVAGH